MDGLLGNAPYFEALTWGVGSVRDTVGADFVAVLRDGRIDRKIKIERPTFDEVQELLFLQLAKAQQQNAAWMASSINIPAVAEALFSFDHHLDTLVNPQTGLQHHFLLQHIVSGAMVVGLVDRAKRRAFRRDRTAGTFTGVTQDDLLAAVAEVFEENKGLNHEYAKRAFVKDIALPAEERILKGERP